MGEWSSISRLLVMGSVMLTSATACILTIISLDTYVKEEKMSASQFQVGARVGAALKSAEIKL